jgi:hypothetical protein
VSGKRGSECWGYSADAFPRLVDVSALEPRKARAPVSVVGLRRFGPGIGCKGG